MQARATARTLAVLTASALGACGDAPSAPGTRDRGPIVPTWEWSGMSGHIGVQLNGGQPEAGFEYGISYYSSVFSLNDRQAEGAQLGWGSWLIPDNRSFAQALCPVGTVARDNWPERGPTYRDVYQTMEGGLGQWTTTRFPSSRPKFRANSTPDCYSTQVATPGWEFYTKPLSDDKLGLAQLSNRLLLPPDGVTLDTTGSPTVLGYGWLALPIVAAHTSPRGVATGDQSWTLFLHASNFTGPVAFFTPETWSAVNATDPTGTGRGHDARPAYHPQVALEVGNTPMITSRDSSGTLYRRIPRLTFPADVDGDAVLIRDVRYYSKQAIWDGIAAWIANGTPATEFQSTGAFAPRMDTRFFGVRLGGSPIIPGNEFDAAAVATPGGDAFALTWSSALEAGVLPEYYVQITGGWSAVPASAVPTETGLAAQVFPPAPRGTIEDLDDSAGSPWSSALWAAGPFTANLNDGSNVDYVWYRFIDQPAITRLGLDASELTQLQSWAESLHTNGGVNGVSFAPPSSGTLATIQATALVTPPTGLEAGYVPIVIRQY